MEIEKITGEPKPIATLRIFVEILRRMATQTDYSDIIHKKEGRETGVPLDGDYMVSMKEAATLIAQILRGVIKIVESDGRQETRTH